MSSWHSKASWSGDIHHPAQDKMKIYENHWATPLFRGHLINIYIYTLCFFWVFSLGFFTNFFVSTSSSKQKKNEEAEKLCDGMDNLATISGEVLGRSAQHAHTHTHLRPMVEIDVESGWFDEFLGFGPFWMSLVPVIMKWRMMSDFDPKYSSIFATRGKHKFPSSFLVIVNSKVWPFEILAQP